VRDHERGSVSIVVVALMAMALVLAMGAADLARVLTGAARAQTAADAAALAAAQELASAASAGVEPVFVPDGRHRGRRHSHRARGCTDAGARRPGRDGARPCGRRASRVELTSAIGP
jgi:Putative Flp pilus-assembly TadE/G-like